MENSSTDNSWILFEEASLKEKTQRSGTVRIVKCLSSRDFQCVITIQGLFGLVINALEINKRYANSCMKSNEIVST